VLKTSKFTIISKETSIVLKIDFSVNISGQTVNMFAGSNLGDFLRM
jgi:hypothetical protein